MRPTPHTDPSSFFSEHKTSSIPPVSFLLSFPYTKYLSSSPFLLYFHSSSPPPPHHWTQDALPSTMNQIERLLS